jgi:hypothetical protein
VLSKCMYMRTSAHSFAVGSLAETLSSELD